MILSCLRFKLFDSHDNDDDDEYDDYDADGLPVTWCPSREQEQQGSRRQPDKPPIAI